MATACVLRSPKSKRLRIGKELAIAMLVVARGYSLLTQTVHRSAWLRSL